MRSGSSLAAAAPSQHLRPRAPTRSTHLDRSQERACLHAAVEGEGDGPVLFRCRARQEQAAGAERAQRQVGDSETARRSAGRRAPSGSSQGGSWPALSTRVAGPGLPIWAFQSSRRHSHHQMTRALAGRGLIFGCPLVGHSSQRRVCRFQEAMRARASVHCTLEGVQMSLRTPSDRDRVARMSHQSVTMGTVFRELCRKFCRKERIDRSFETLRATKVILA